jgi:hypothetical protein
MNDLSKLFEIDLLDSKVFEISYLKVHYKITFSIAKSNCEKN